MLQSLESRAAARLKPPNHMQDFFVLNVVCLFIFFSFRCRGLACAIFFSLVSFLLFACLNGSFRCVASYFSLKSKFLEISILQTLSFRSIFIRFFKNINID